MAIVKNIHGFYFLGIRGKVGLPCGLGQIRPAWSKNGDSFTQSGIFRKDPRIKQKGLQRMRHYNPTNNQLPFQQVWRDYFRNCVAIYHALDTETCNIFEKHAKKYKMTTYNYFISNYTLKKPSHCGNFRVGFTQNGKKMWLM